MSLSEILKSGEIQLSQDTILFMANEIRTVAENTRNAGKPYLHGSFVGKDQKGDWTSQKLIHVFPTVSNLDSIDTVYEEDRFFLVTGRYDERETDQGNLVLSLSDARFASFNDNGEFRFSDDKGTTTLKGEPGKLVSVEIRIKAVFKTAAKLDDGNRPNRNREPIKTRTNQGMGSVRRKTKPTEPELQPEPEPQLEPQPEEVNA